MSWFSENKFLAGLLVVTVAGVGGAGYYLSTRYAGYSDARDTFDSKRNRITSLKSKQLYPSDENVKLIEDSVTTYEGEVTKLQEQLLKFQKPLNVTMKDTEFQQLVKERVAAVQKLAEIGKLELPENFYMGLLKYRLDVPEPAAVGLLDYQLKAIERMMEAVVRSGMGQLIALERDPLAVEADDYEAPEVSPALEKYPLKLTLSGTHEALRSFFNELSNDTEYFFNVRFFRMENSAKSGPLRGEKSDAEPEEEGIDDDPLDIGTDDEGEEEEDDEGLNYDAQIVMGNEEIQAHLVIDLVRFVEID